MAAFAHGKQYLPISLPSAARSIPVEGRLHPRLRQRTGTSRSNRAGTAICGCSSLSDWFDSVVCIIKLFAMSSGPACRGLCRCNNHALGYTRTAVA
jgi:hypothetical protein